MNRTPDSQNYCPIYDPKKCPDCHPTRQEINGCIDNHNQTIASKESSRRAQPLQIGRFNGNQRVSHFTFGENDTIQGDHRTDQGDQGHAY